MSSRPGFHFDVLLHFFSLVPIRERVACCAPNHQLSTQIYSRSMSDFFPFPFPIRDFFFVRLHLNNFLFHQMGGGGWTISFEPIIDTDGITNDIIRGHNNNKNGRYIGSRLSKRHTFLLGLALRLPFLPSFLRRREQGRQVEHRSSNIFFRSTFSSSLVVWLLVHSIRATFLFKF